MATVFNINQVFIHVKSEVAKHAAIKITFLLICFSAKFWFHLPLTYRLWSWRYWKQAAIKMPPVLPWMFAFIYHLPVDYEVDRIGSRTPKRCLPFLPWIFAFIYHWPVDYEVEGIRSKPPLSCLLSLLVGNYLDSPFITDRSLMKLTALETGRHKHIFFLVCFCTEFLISFSTYLSIMKLTVLEAGRHKYIFSSGLFLHWILVSNYHWPVDYEVDGIRSRPPLWCLRSLIVGPEWHSSLISDLSIIKLTVLEAGRHKPIFSSRLFLHWVCAFI